MSTPRPVPTPAPIPHPPGATAPRRRAGWTAVLVASATLAACGGGSGDVPATAPTAAATPAPAPAPTPAPAPAPTPAPSPAPSGSYGTLALSGSTTATAFTPSGSLASFPTSSGPTCTTIGGDTVCTSILALNWDQVVVDSLGAEQPVGVVTVALTSTVHAATGNPPGVGVNSITVAFNAGAKPYFNLYCDDTGVIACTTADAGIGWDLAAHTVTFNHTTVPEDPPGTGSVVLDGTLHY